MPSVGEEEEGVEGGIRAEERCVVYFYFYYCFSLFFFFTSSSPKVIMGEHKRTETGQNRGDALGRIQGNARQGRSI